MTEGTFKRNIWLFGLYERQIIGSVPVSLSSKQPLLSCLLSSFTGGKSAFGRKSQATITQYDI